MESAVILASSDNHGLTDECQKLTNKIRGALFDIAHSFVYIGFLLAECDYYETYKEWGYSSIHEYALDQFGFKKSSTYNFINICKQFSDNEQNAKNLNFPYSMTIKGDYREFNYSQLVEMLSMNDKQRSQVTSDMSVKQIREFKKSSDEPEYAKLYNAQLHFEKFDETYTRRINGKTMMMRVYGDSSLNLNVYPEGYYFSVWVDYGSSSHSCPHDRIVDYKKFKEHIFELWHYYDKSYDSRSLESVPEEAPAPDAPEEASAPDVPAELEPEVVSYPGYDLLVPLRSDLHALFNSIEEAYLDIHKNIDSDLFDIVFGYLKSNDYIICKKVNKKPKNRFTLK